MKKENAIKHMDLVLQELGMSREHVRELAQKAQVDDEFNMRALALAVIFGVIWREESMAPLLAVSRIYTEHISAVVLEANEFLMKLGPVQRE